MDGLKYYTRQLYMNGLKYYTRQLFEGVSINIVNENKP